MNEFVARNGLIALDSSSISGPLTVSGSILATSGISTSDNIGIGTSSPAAKLDVRGNISSSGNFTISGNIYKSVDTNNLGLYGGTTNSVLNGFIKIHGQSNLWGQVQINIGYEPDNSKGIWTLNDSTQLMTLTGRGRLGIGTTSPSTTLDVRGNTYLSGSVGIQIASPAEALHIKGNLKVQTVSTPDGPGIASIILNPEVSTTATIQTLTNFGPTSATVYSAGFKFITRNRDASLANPYYDVDAMSILANGSVGIGTTTDTSAKLHISGSTGALLRVSSNASSNILFISSSGNVGIGTTSPTYRLDINGSFRASGSITATSGSDYFDVSHDITQPAQTGSQVYEVNITPTLRYTAPNQTQTALRVAATFSGSTALSSSQSNIIADFGSTSAGSQLVINDTTSGSIYMVNDVSGLPIIEANSNWDVFIYDYPNVVLKKTGSQIDITGKLKVSGSFILPLSQSTSPETGSAYWSGSFLYIYDGTQYRSASFS